MLKKKRIWLPILVILVLVIGFLLLPLSSDKWNIHFDKKAIEAKKAFLSQVKSKTTQKPNIIIITADDLGKTDISLYGNTLINTKHIDAIAKNGVKFTKGYVTSPICSPSRASLMTGRYQQRFGYEVQPQNRYPKNRLEYYFFKYFMDTGNWIVRPEESYPTAEAMQNQGLPPSELTLSELLKAVGYRTGIVGKWHLGYKQDFFLPNKRGFDYQYGFYEAFSLFADTTEDNIINQRHDDFTDWYIWGQGRKGGFAIRKNNKIITEKRYLTTAIAEESIDFIERNKEEPFFLYIPFNAPHTPFQATKKHYAQFAHIKDRNKRVYYAMIQALDEAVGMIMKKLKKEGLDKNTIIFFSSDNGGATYTKATNNKPLKGGKISPFEGGINVPMAVQWKGKIPSNQVYENPVCMFDFFTTSTHLAGIDLPKDRVFDGVDLLPFITGQKYEAPHETLYWRSLECQAIVKGDWKMIINRGEVLLYDLAKDPEERENLVKLYPNIIRELEKDLKAWQEDLKDPLWPHVMNYHFIINQNESYIFAF